MMRRAAKHVCSACALSLLVLIMVMEVKTRFTGAIIDGTYYFTETAFLAKGSHCQRYVDRTRADIKVGVGRELYYTSLPTTLTGLSISLRLTAFSMSVSGAHF